MKPWFSHKNCRRSSYASRNLISKTGMASWDNSRQNEARIFEIRRKLSKREQKSALSLYFWVDFNNSPTILTRIVSQSHTCFRNKNRTSVARTATVFVGVLEFPRHRAATLSLCLKGQCWDVRLVFFHESVPLSWWQILPPISTKPSA